MVDGASYLAAFIHNHRHTGIWGNARGSNVLDSGAPFYETYRTKDGTLHRISAFAFAPPPRGVCLRFALTLFTLKASTSPWALLSRSFTAI